MVFLGELVAGKQNREAEGERILFPNLSNGDVLALYRGLEPLQRINHTKTTTIILDNGLKRTAKELGFGTVIPGSVYSMLPMSKAVLFRPSRYKKLIFSEPWHVFNLQAMIRDAGIRELPSSISEKTIEKVFGSSNCKGKCVILSPYEQTLTASGLPMLSTLFWETLAKKLKEKNLRVFTNCDGKKELLIPGTEVFFPPIREIPGGVDYAGYCVAVRSGFVDFSAYAGSARQVFFYPSEKFLEIFSMKYLKEQNPPLELVYGEKEQENMQYIQKIIDFFGLE